MDIRLLFIGLAALCIIVLSYFIRLQHRTHQDSLKKSEIKLQYQIIRSTQEIIGCADVIPFSKEIRLCLLRRMENSFTLIANLDPSDKRAAVNSENINNQIASQTAKVQDPDDLEYTVPNDEQKAINALKVVKRLKGIIKSEHRKGTINSQDLLVEQTRLDQLQIQINIESLINRADHQIMTGKTGTAKQLLKKGISVLEAKNDDYSIEKCIDLTEMLNELETEQKRRQVEFIKSKENTVPTRSKEIAALFSDQKKQW